ncbi:MAG: hypothetical protein ACRDZR_18705, partial [Acidimicrobiales bacterium]
MPVATTTMPYEPSAIEEHFVELLSTLGKALEQTASVAFVAADGAGTWTAPRRGDLALEVATLARTSLEHDGPWGLVQAEDAGAGAVWLEPVHARPPEGAGGPPTGRA